MSGSLTPRVVLASASPRRLELLQRIGLEPMVVPADVDETVLPGESPGDYVLRVALDKAHAALGSLTPGDDHDPVIVLAADTSVVLDDEVLGKPADETEATGMLRRLSGRTHEVLTAVAVIGPDAIEHSTVARTTVRFAALSAEEIRWYVSSGEPFGKAGAYALQGAGEFMIEEIRGAASTVIGLPLRATVELLTGAGLRWPRP